jgi:gamma-glutamyltranspeptidase/glutathione hydrolase
MVVSEVRYTFSMPAFTWDLTYPSQREAVLARNIVATSQPLAAQAGLQTLREGGNAIDAAVATAIALTVIEPTSNGIGADTFALVWAGGGLHGLNGSGRAPRSLKPEIFGGQSTIPTAGWGCVTVPGAVAAWAALSERFGALPFEKLCEPAIRYAREGFPVARQTAFYWDRGFQLHREREGWARTFSPQGRPIRAGEVFRSEDHASALESIARSRGQSFYRGELAARIASYARETGGFITEEDLAEHQSEWVRPISQEYAGASLHEIPPNGQGLVALIALGILSHFNLADLDPDSPESLHLQIEAMKLAFADGHRYIADPNFMDVSVDDLLDPAYLEARAALIDRSHAQDFGHGQPREGGTIYLTAADAAGNMVSYIQSNYTGFGSGIVVPGTGIALQSRGACFTLEEGHPNQMGPWKRPYHTIIPGFVMKDGAPLMSFGVMGGFMQPQGHAQVVVRLLTYGQNPQCALDAPRWRVESGLKVVLEPGFPQRVCDELRDLGHDLSIAPAKTVEHGGGQAIYCLDEGVYFGASDLRRDGQAVGF